MLSSAFPHDLMVIISFHFLLQSSETVDIMTKLFDFPDLSVHCDKITMEALSDGIVTLNINPSVNINFDLFVYA